MAPAFGLSVNGCLQGGLQLEHPIHTARRISWKLFSGRAGLGGDGADHELHPLGMNDSYASSSSLDSTLSRYFRCVPATHCEGPSFVKPSHLEIRHGQILRQEISGAPKARKWESKASRSYGISHGCHGLLSCAARLSSWCKSVIAEIPKQPCGCRP